MATADVVKKSKPLGRNVSSIVLDYSVDDTTIESDIDLNGTILDVWFVVPALDGTQGTLSFEDEDISFVDSQDAICGTCVEQIDSAKESAG